MKLELFLASFLFASVACGPIQSSDLQKLESYLLQRKDEISEESTFCELCRVTIDGLHFLLGNTKLTSECLGAIMDYGCSVFAHEDSRVCEGIQSQWRDEILYVALKVIVEPREICGLLFSDCGRPYNPLTVNWTIPIPGNKPPVQPWTQPKAGAKTLKIVQISDVHYDKLYLPGSEAKCGEPLCCRKPPAPGQKVSVPAGYWGTAAACDIPARTIESIMEHIAQVEKPDAVYWTGDLNPHNVWNQSRADQIFDLGKLQGWLTSHFTPGLVFPAVGNHESTPCDSFPPSWAPAQYNMAWLYDVLANQWSQLQPSLDKEPIRHRASYSIRPWPNFRLISLNTQMGDDFNFWLIANESDPDGTMTWLASELAAAEAAGEKVHIIGHIPPGESNPGFLPAWGRLFYQLVNRYESTIRGQFYGHTHDDSFRLFYAGAKYPSRATNMAYVAPSMTTYEHHLPSYRVYTVDGNYPGSSYQVLDSVTYLLDLEYMNKYNKTRFVREYAAKTAFGMKSLTPSDWDSAITAMKTDDAMFQRYNVYHHHYAFSNPPGKCSGTCRNGRLCALRSGLMLGQLQFCSDLFPLPLLQSPKRTGKSMPQLLPDIVRLNWINRILDACRKAG